MWNYAEVFIHEHSVICSQKQTVLNEGVGQQKLWALENLLGMDMDIEMDLNPQKIIPYTL